MADNRNRIYRCEYTKNGSKYRMDIIPPYSEVLFKEVDKITQVSAIPIVNISANAFNKINDLNSKFVEKLPKGMVAADDLKVTADLSYMPNELVDYMQEPFYDMTASIDYTIGEPETRISPAPLSMTTATVFILKKETALNTWETLFVGTPKKTPENKQKAIKGVVTVDFDLIDISKTVYALVTSSLISTGMLLNGKAGNINTVYLDQYIDTQFTDTFKGESKYVVFHHHNFTAGKHNAFGIWFYIQDLFIQIDILAAQIHAKFLRCPVDEITIGAINNPFIALKHYLQDHNAQGRTIGNVSGCTIPYGQLMFLGASWVKGFLEKTVAFEPINHSAGFLVDQKDNKNNIHEHKTAWDFYKALAETNCCKMNIQFTDEKTISVNWLRLLEKNPNNTPIIPDYENTNGEYFELTRNYNVLNGVKCSLTDQMEKNDEDISYANDGSKAEPDDEYKSLFHTIPTVIGDNAYNAEAKNYVSISVEKTFKQFCNGKLYYYEPNNANVWTYLKTPGTDTGNMIKCHENISIDDGVTIHDFINYPLLTFLSYFKYDSTEFSGQSIIFSRTCNSEIWKCMFLADNFGNYSQCLWEMECDSTGDLTLKHIGDTVAAPEISEGQIELLIGQDPSPEHPDGVPGVNYPLGKMLQLYFTVGAAGRTFTILDITTDLDKAVTKAKIFIKGK